MKNIKIISLLTLTAVLLTSCTPKQAAPTTVPVAQVTESQVSSEPETTSTEKTTDPDYDHGVAAPLGSLPDDLNKKLEPYSEHSIFCVDDSFLTREFPGAAETAEDIQKQFGITDTINPGAVAMKIPKADYDYDLFKKMFFGEWTVMSSPHFLLTINDDAQFVYFDNEDASGKKSLTKIGTIYKFNENVYGLIYRAPAGSGGTLKMIYIDKTMPDLLFRCSPSSSQLESENNLIVLNKPEEILVRTKTSETVKTPSVTTDALADNFDPNYVAPLGSLPNDLNKKLEPYFKAHTFAVDDGFLISKFPEAARTAEDIQKQFGITDTIAPRAVAIKIPKADYDYDLFKQMFFGEWTAMSSPHFLLTINDDSKFVDYNAIPKEIGEEIPTKIGTIYKFSENVYGLIYSAPADSGGTLKMIYIDKTMPDLLFMCSPGSSLLESEHNLIMLSTPEFYVRTK